jgi:transcriptional regulator
MYSPPPHDQFAARTPADLQRVVDAYPLAWIVSAAGEGSVATPLPLIPNTDGDGNILSLTGHFSLANPQVPALRRQAAATVLFMGPQGYVSPELVSQSRWAPTWNYAVVRFDVEVEFRPDENHAALGRLVERMERGRPDPWTTAALGERYAELARRIIAFRAHVRSAHAKFKLGQDERRETFAEIVHGLGDRELARWMQDFAG